MSLIGWWPLTDESAQDYSGNGNNGTRNGATTGVSGRGGLQAMSFDGSDDTVSLGDIFEMEFMSNSTHTISLWFSVDAVTTGDNVLIGKYDANEGGWFFQITDTNSDSSNEARVFLRDGPNNLNDEVYSDTDVPINEWVHLVVVRDSSGPSGISIFINGSESSVTVDNSEGSGDITTSQSATIGGRGDGVAQFEGDISSVRSYDRALSSSEIQTLYEWGSIDVAHPAGADDGGVSYYSFNSSGATDQWGTNDGTVNGATYLSSGGPRNDGAYSFDGSDDFISLGTEVLNLNNWSVSVWAEANDTNRRNILSKWQPSVQSTWSEMIFRVINGELAVVAWDDSETGYSASYGVPATSSFYNVVVTGDGDSGELRAYVNGEQFFSQSVSTGQTGNSVETYLGKRNDDQFYWDGEIDDLRIYNRALSPSEVHELYQYGTFGKDMRKDLVTKR